IFSKEGREIIKKVGTAVAAGVTALLQFAFQLLAQFKFTILGTFIGGSILGLPGATAGFFIGRILDKGVIHFFQNIGGSLAGASGAGLGGTTAAATAGIAGAGAATTGLAALSPAMAVPVSIGLVGFLSYNYFVNVNSSFVLPAELGIFDPETTPYAQDKTLSVTKKADLGIIEESGTTIQYTIEVSSQEGEITNVIITDDFDENYLEIHSISHLPTSRNGTITWDIDQMVQNGKLSRDFSEAGNTFRITYSAVTKPGVNRQTRIYNETTVTATTKEGDEITRRAYFTLNSACQDIVAKAGEIMNDLIMASDSQCERINSGCVNWIRTNRWEGYLHGYNCPVSEEILAQTRPLSTTGGCVVCNDLVTMSYVLTNHQNPQTTGWETTAQRWRENGLLVIDKGKGDISRVSEGDIVYFDVQRRNNGSSYLDTFSHVGIVAGVTLSGIYTWESNTSQNIQRFYSYSQGAFLPLGGVVFVNAIGDTCQD
ncbi:MAG TPA: hypothetical protein VMW29_02290, partial [Candidatus Bathyarchaeia archaeon]|nr:hypothetical protein [Candidatus Bathyarchaeia archaeon]